MAKKLGKKESTGTGLSSARKVEIIGISLIAIAVLVGLSIVSYTPEDYQYVRSLSFGDVFQPDTSARLIQNFLGPVGAFLSHLLVFYAFGYMSILIAGILGYTGWHIFRQRSLQERSQTIALTLWAMVLLSTFLGWTHSNWGFPESSVWSGSSGLALSRILQNITGIGSVFILVVLLAINALLFIDRDLQKTIDNLKFWWSRFREEQQNKRIEKEAEKQQKKEEREERVAQKMAELALEKEREVKGVQEEPKRPKTTKKDSDPVDIDKIIEQSKIEDQKRLDQQREEESK